jgi:amidase
MQASLERAEELAHLGALARIEPEFGLAAARRADDAPNERRGPFHGVPFLAKNLGSYASGLGPTAGSAALARANEDPTNDDHLFARFRASGLIPFGLTTVPEFGQALTSEPPGAAPALNPWDEALSPGGSSGGAAAAVAAGIVAIAHATDAAGSIRVPAACTGLVGLKPSRGRVPGGPHFDNYLMGMASELVLARSVRDVRHAFDAVKIETPSKPAPLKHVGLATSLRCSDDTNSRMEQVARTLETQGLEIVPIDDIDAFGLEAHRLVRTVFRVGLANWLDLAGLGEADVSPLAFAIAEEGQAMPGTAIYALSKQIAQFSFEVLALFEDVDAILCPVLAKGPPKLGTFNTNLSEPEAHYDMMEAVAPNAALANVAGLPSLALPFGMLSNAPFGVQLMSRQGTDESLLAVGRTFEAIAPSLTFPYPIAGLA